MKELGEVGGQGVGTCRACGYRVAVPNMPIIRGVGMAASLDSPVTPIAGGVWEASVTCPRCGAEVVVDNLSTARMPGGFTSVFFSSTAEDRDRVLHLLGALDAEASVEEVASMLESQGPHFHPLAQYLRDNHLQLIGLGVSVVSVVIALLAWLLPAQDQEQPPPVPDGITYDQMERLVEQLRDEIDARSNPAKRRDASRNSRNAHSSGTENGRRGKRDETAE